MWINLSKYFDDKYWPAFYVTLNGRDYCIAATQIENYSWEAGTINFKYFPKHEPNEENYRTVVRNMLRRPL